MTGIRKTSEMGNLAGINEIPGVKTPTEKTYLTPLAVSLGEVATSTLGHIGDKPEQFIDDWYGKTRPHP